MIQFAWQSLSFLSLNFEFNNFPHIQFKRFCLFYSIPFYSTLFYASNHIYPTLGSNEAFSHTPNLTTCHWVINIQMTCTYSVIRTPKCHQMLKIHHLQIRNPVSAGKKLLAMPFWLKSRHLISYYGIGLWQLGLLVEVVVVMMTGGGGE